VVNAFERYFACGDFSRGFVRCHCDACRHDVLVAFSCKGRGVCPSCAGRRMCNEAACITDRVLPNVPVGQWVLSTPFDLRALAATKPDVRTAIGRTFAQEISRATKRLANVEGAETGVVSFHQNFGGSLKEAGELLSDGGSAAERKTANVICQGGSCSDATLPRYCTWLCRNDGDCTAAAPHCLPQTFGATTMNVCKR
jgi:hypothetical protein